MKLEGKKRWLLAAPAVTLVAGVAAWAAVMLGMPFVGSVSGEDLVSAAQYESLEAAQGNAPQCTWSITGDRKLRLDAVKIARAPSSTACTTIVNVANAGETQLRVQGFQAASTVGTVAAGVAAYNGGCGATLDPGTMKGVQVKVTFSNVNAGQSGTLSGELRLVDAASYDPAACAVAA